MSEKWLSELAVSDESVPLVAARLALECEAFAAANGIPQAAVQGKLGLIHDILLRNLPDLIEVGPVVAGGATDLVVVVTFRPEVYRRTAKAAQDALCL